MWTVNVILPYGIRFTITPHGLLVASAWLAAALLLGSYVTVLHQAVERGEKLRAEQRHAAAKPSEKTRHTASISPAATKP